MQGIAGFSAQRSCADGGKADGDACLRDQGEPQIISRFLWLFDSQAAPKGARIFSYDPHKEVQNSYQQQGNAADCS